MHTLKLNTDAVKYILRLIRESCLNEHTEYDAIVRATKLINIIQEQSGLSE